MGCYCYEPTLRNSRYYQQDSRKNTLYSLQLNYHLVDAPSLTSKVIHKSEEIGSLANRFKMVNLCSNTTCTANLKSVKCRQVYYYKVHCEGTKTTTDCKWKGIFINLNAHSHKLCNKSINWELAKLLLLCGDIELNPGPIALDDKLELQLLQSIKWHDNNGVEKELRICQELASYWKELADFMGLSQSQIRIIEEQQSTIERCTKMFEIWIDCHSNLSSQYSCSWRGLCTLLGNIGSFSLQNDIKHVINSYSAFGEESYLEAYHHFIHTKESLSLPFLKFLFIGPPGLGKTTLRRRLLKEIIDLISAGEEDHFQPSTGTVESSDVVISGVSSTTAVIYKSEESEWSEITSLVDEAQMLIHCLMSTVRNKHPSTISQNDDVPRHNQSYSTGSKFLPVVRETQQLLVPATSSGTASSQQEPRLSQHFSKASAILKEAFASDHWKNIKHEFKAYIKMEDTGGQPELMDMLPALTLGPGLYLLFINLQNDLNHHYKLTYLNTSGTSTPPVESAYSVKEMLLSSLSSIFSFNACLPASRLSTSVPYLENRLESFKSVAHIVGTHKDKVSNECIKKMNEDLRKIIIPTEFYKQDIVQAATEEELIVAVDNMAGGAEEVQKVKSLLENTMARHFKKLEIPAVWLFFSLFLRHHEKRTVSLDYCMELSSTLGMSVHETEVALWFLHHHAGVLMYFPNIPELTDLVIIDVQVVYDSVTNLILQAMNYDNVGSVSEFKKMGKFTKSHIIAATHKVSGDHIPIDKLLVLLEFLHIIARISSCQSNSLSSSNLKEVTYMMPCVLWNANREKLDSFTEKLQEVPPILFHFSCGTVPMGLFPALISCLISTKSFTLIQHEFYKNFVKFRYGRWRTLVVFSCYSNFYQISISTNSSKVKLHEECDSIRKRIMSILQKVTSRFNYGSLVDYQFAFDCPLHQDCNRQHVCVVHGEKNVPQVMVCLENAESPHPVELSDSHKQWFGQIPMKSQTSSDEDYWDNEDPKYSLEDEQKLVSEHEPVLPRTDYKPYLNKIEFIIAVVGEKEYRAAICNLQKPCGEGFEEMEVVVLEKNLIVGSLASMPILIVKSVDVEKPREDLEKALDVCPKAKYIISVGTGFAFQMKDIKVGEIFISSSVSLIEHYCVSKQGDTASIDIQKETSVDVCDLLKNIFTSNTNSIADFDISKTRKAVYHVSNIISGMSLNDPTLSDAKNVSVQPFAIGGDLYVHELIQLQTSNRIRGFAAVKSVTSYVGGSRYSKWDFTGAMAAFHYVKEKMKPYMRHIRAVDNYLESIKSSENVVDVAVAKLIFLGPSMQGKTVTRKRLTNTITNISSGKIDDKSNTGISEQTTVICGNLHRSTVLAAKEDIWNWKIIKDIEEEVELYIHAKHHQLMASITRHTQCQGSSSRKHAPEETPQSSISVPSNSALPAESQQSPSLECPKNEINVSFQPSINLSVDDVHVSPENIYQFLKKKEAYTLNEITEHLNKKCLIFLQDTGGQPELMDCLPALTIGPALYLLFCKLNTNLDDNYKIGYRGPDGKTSSLLSNCSIKKTLMSALASISCMLYSSSEDTRTENRAQCVYIIGTHRDKVEDDTIDTFEKNVQAIMHSTFIRDKGLIKEWHQDDLPSDSTLTDIPNRLVYPLNNKFGEEEEMQCLRRAISKRIDKYARKAISSQWLVFSIVLRGRPEVVLNLDTCFEIGTFFDMNDKQTKAALHFLHYNLGICMHFANVKELQDVVITNTQAIYQTLTTIIEAAYKPGIILDAAATKFKNTGQFTLESFAEVNPPLSLDILVLILEHLNIIVHLSPTIEEETKYFMPCILPNASNEEIESYEKEDKMPPELSPLYIRYDCGFVPIGVFPAMVANLIQQGSKAESAYIRLKHNRMKRNYIQFSYGEDRDTLTLIHKSEYIKIRISRESDCELKLHQLCPKIMRLMVTTLTSVSGSMLHSLYTDFSKEKYKHHFEKYSFAFQCYYHSESDHLCTISNNEKNPRRMDCVREHTLKMEPKHQVWYGKEISDYSCDNKTERYPFNLSNMSLLKWTDSDNVMHKVRVIDRVSENWKKFSDLLGLPPEQTGCIETNLKKVQDCCREVFVKWLSSSDEEYNYSPTWDGLLELLDDLELSGLAEEIKNVVLLKISQSK